MKKTIKHLLSAIMVGTFLFIAIGSDDDESTESFSNSSSSSSSNSIDGTYTSSVSGGGAGGEFSVSIYGDSWSSILKINSYDNGTYEYGTVRGKNLYDESGFVKVGYVSGNTVTMGRFSATK
tara:strand:- start:455 stop:820 length:366 start_codon:yes stop_codon:yes gene_type:complete